jgi:hypothetical protein
VRYFLLRRRPRRQSSRPFLQTRGKFVARIFAVSVKGSPPPALPPSSLPPGILSPKTRAAPHPHFSCVTDSLETSTEGQVSLCYRKKPVFASARVLEPMQWFRELLMTDHFTKHALIGVLCGGLRGSRVSPVGWAVLGARPGKLAQLVFGLLLKSQASGPGAKRNTNKRRHTEELFLRRHPLILSRR